MFMVQLYCTSTSSHVYHLELLIWVFTNINGRMKCSNKKN